MMFALRFASLFLLASTSLVSNTVAAPAPGVAVAQKRASTADIEAILDTLKGSTATILPQIASLSTSGNASFETVSPLTTKLTAALDAASSSLAGLASAGSKKRQSDDDIANVVAELITDITDALDGLLGIPAVGPLLPGLDVALNQVLLGLETLLAGVLNLVAQLLVDVAGLLRNLAFGLTLATLGL